MGTLELTWKWLGRHKCIILCVLFFVNLIFLDQNSVLHSFEQYKMIAALQAEKDKYVSQCERNVKQLQLLKTNPEAVERIAREVYFMKRADEDLYIFEYEGSGDNGNEAAK